MCGIIACFNHPNAAEEIFLGAQQQQHRGQEGAGLVTHYKGRNIYLKRTGLINLHPEFAQLPGKIAAMHLRYSTQGESIPENLQPAIHSTDEGRWVLGSNGDLPFYWSIRQKYERKNWYFNTKNDAELLLRIITYHYNQLSNIKNKDDRVAEAIIRMQNEVQGAYSAFMLTPWGTMFIFRDPWAVRPLAYGQKNNTHYFSSETSAFDVLQVEYRRDVLAGEITSINQKLQVTTYEQNKMQPANCIFEYVYFARPDSLIFGLSSGKAKTALGVKLATKHPVDADIVIPVPDSSNHAAMGFSRKSGIQFEFGLIRNHYIGRTFIEPQQADRDAKVKIKFNSDRDILADQRVVLVDDSIVRATTIRKLCSMMRKSDSRSGASEVHVRIASSPIVNPCYLGMDFPDSDELIASRMSVEEIREFIGADSLEYLSVEEMLECVPNGGKGYCTGCFNGCYPQGMEIPDKKLKC